MAGQIRRALDAIITARSKGDPTVAMTTKTKLLIKGFDYDAYGPGAPDDDRVVAALRDVAKDMKLSVSF